MQAPYELKTKNKNLDTRYEVITGALKQSNFNMNIGAGLKNGARSHPPRVPSGASL